MSQTEAALFKAGTVQAADLASTLDLTGKTVSCRLVLVGKFYKLFKRKKPTLFPLLPQLESTIQFFSASITPAATANKILIMWSSNVSAATGQRGDLGYLEIQLR